MYVYVRSERGLHTVGFYTPDGEWVSESDHPDPEDAARRVAYLNGGREGPPVAMSEQVREVVGEALDALYHTYSWWLTSRAATDAERALAVTRMRQARSAKKTLDL
jgi:hypothetical protein